MVKFYSQNYSYDHPFATVSLAYFLRYPNPYSRHVISTDVLERTFDAASQRLYTTRLHLKRSRLPAAVLKILPRSILGATARGDSQTYILETSVVDVKEGWMTTESRNLEFTAVLDVIERQTYIRNTPATRTQPSQHAPPSLFERAKDLGTEEKTDVSTVVTLHSSFGQRLKRSLNQTQSDEASQPRMGFLARWSQASLQRSIEAIGLNRTSKSQPNATEGMKIVLERLRQGGIVAVLEGMRKDRESTLGP